MDELVEKVMAARCYLTYLPDMLPAASPESSVNSLLTFSLSPEWVEDVGEEGAVNQALEAALFNFLPRNDAGIFKISTRGPAISALPDILETWIRKYPTSAILQNWLQNTLDSAKACFADYNVPVSKYVNITWSQFHGLLVPVTVTSSRASPDQRNERIYKTSQWTQVNSKDSGPKEDGERR
jgi:hypothetical protein